MITPTSIWLRGGSGFGDSIYVQSVARYLVEQGEHVIVASDHDDVFRPLRGKVKVIKHARDRRFRVAHYTLRRTYGNTNQWEDVCISAGVPKGTPLRLDWTQTDPNLCEDIAAKAGDRPLVLVQLPRYPMNRTDGFALELLPNGDVMQSMISEMSKTCYLVQVGAAASNSHVLYKFKDIHCDLTNKTTIAQLIDLAQIADGMFGYVSFMVPLAESLSKPALFLWSRQGLRSRQNVIPLITPKKILSSPKSKYVIDDANYKDRMGAVHDFLLEARRTEKVLPQQDSVPGWERPVVTAE